MHIKYVYKNRGGKYMQFTDEERKIIDKLLAEGEEMQRQCGNRIYTTEEVWGELMEIYHKDLQNWLG